MTAFLLTMMADLKGRSRRSLKVLWQATFAYRMHSEFILQTSIFWFEMRRRCEENATSHKVSVDPNFWRKSRSSWNIIIKLIWRFWVWQFNFRCCFQRMCVRLRYQRFCFPTWERNLILKLKSLRMITTKCSRSHKSAILFFSWRVNSLMKASLLRLGFIFFWFLVKQTKIEIQLKHWGRIAPTSVNLTSVKNDFIF